MKIETCEKESFVVIGKEGATTDGAGFIQKLWDEANSHFEEIAHLAKKEALLGLCQSHFSRSHPTTLDSLIPGS